MENNQKISNELLKLYLNGYLKNKNLIDSDTELKNNGVIQEKGVLYGCQIVALQTIIQEELKVFGLDLIEILNSKGIEFKPGEFSELEHQYINFKVKNIIAFIENYEARKNSK